MKKLFDIKRTLLLAAAVSHLMAFTSVSAPYDKALGGGSFPFDIELDRESCERLCYAGHPSSGVKYVTGYAITPYTSFSLSVAGGADTGTEAEGLSVEIALIYENEGNTTSSRETLRTYGKGDLEEGTYYPLFEETNIENLSERGRLYSDSLSSVELKLSYDGMRGKSSDMAIYLQVCSEEELSDMLMSEGM